MVKIYYALVHCIKSELYLAKWKWILPSGPNRSNGSFPNPLNWWRIRFGLICCWRNTFTTDSLRSRPPPSPNTKETVLCIQRDPTSHHQFTKLRLWPLDHSNSDVWWERERLNINYKLGYCWLSLHHFTSLNASPRKQKMLAENHPGTLTKRFSTYWQVQCLSLLNFLSE